MSRNFRVTGKEIKYQNPWLDLKEYAISRDGESGIYGVVERGHAVIIIASTADGRILFVKQYRFPTESYSWELPMGGIDPGEESATAARRELREETGLVTSVSKISSYRPIPGLSPQTATVYSAVIPDDEIAKVESFDDEVDEIVERRLLSRSDIKTMIASGEISDGYTPSALALNDLLT